MRWLIERHLELTASPVAARVLADWAETVQHMWLVAPIGRVRRIEAQQEGRVAASA